MCNAGFGWRQDFVRPALLMLGAVGGIHARGQKTFLLNLYRLIDTQGRGVHGPDEPACAEPLRQRQARP